MLLGQLVFVRRESACIMSFASRELGEIAVITFAISLFTAICSSQARGERHHRPLLGSFEEATHQSSLHNCGRLLLPGAFHTPSVRSTIQRKSNCRKLAPQFCKRRLRRGRLLQSSVGQP